MWIQFSSRTFNRPSKLMTFFFFNLKGVLRGKEWDLGKIPEISRGIGKIKSLKKGDSYWKPLHLRNLTWIQRKMVCKMNLLSQITFFRISIYDKFQGGSIFQVPMLNSGVYRGCSAGCHEAESDALQSRNEQIIHIKYILDLPPNQQINHFNKDSATNQPTTK